MAGRLCRICADEVLRKKAGELIAAGLSDQEAAKQLGLKAGQSGDAGRVQFRRHRTNCVQKPARAILQAANKGRDVTEQRKEMVAAAQSGDTVAQFLGLEEIVESLRSVSNRLERQASAAENDGQRLAVASLSAQQLRASEVRARLGGTGGYAPPKANPMVAPAFSINFVFSAAHKPERIECTPTAVIEGDPQPMPVLPLGSVEPGILAPAEFEDGAWDREEDV